MQNKKPVDGYYYSEKEWARLGCGPLPPERVRERMRKQSHQDMHAKGNPPIDKNIVKGYN